MEEDLSFMCTPPYYWLYDKYGDEIELLPYAPVFDDPRNNGEPLYFSDILVNKDNLNIKNLDDLNNHIWAYNDTESLSGYFCINYYKNLCGTKPVATQIPNVLLIDNILFDSQNKNNPDFKNSYENLKMVCSGSHNDSIDMVLSGKADITCIDSNVLFFQNITNLKQIGMFGPHPVQPCIIKKNCEYKDAIIRAFSEINNDSICKILKDKFHINKFKKLNEKFYFKKYFIINLL